MAKDIIFKADRLKEVMKEHEVEYKEIFEKFEKGCDKYYTSARLNGIIEGRTEPTIGELVTICNVCNCSADYLLGLSDEIYG